MLVTAPYYGKIRLPGVEADGYVLSTGIGCLSELGASRVLGFSTHSVLNNIVSNKGPKEIKSFLINELTLSQTVMVTADCHQRNSEIKVYTAKTINTIARAYATAYLAGKLRKNQIHIGLHCAVLRNTLADVALEQIIYDGCGYRVPETLPERMERQWQDQEAFMNAVSLIQELGFNCSFPNQVATKKDIVDFLKVPAGTLNSFLQKHRDEIKPVRIDSATIRSMGGKAQRMNGYRIDDVVKIVCGMDTETGIAFRKKLFGDMASFVSPRVKTETEWRPFLAKIFEGLDPRFNHPVGNYRADCFVGKLMLVLECNGYDCHRRYDPEKEAEREKAISQKYKMVRFHHKVSVEALFNGILRAEVGSVVRLYDSEYLVKP